MPSLNDIAALASQWDTRELTVAASAVTVVQLVGPDPKRWLIAFAASNAVGHFVTSQGNGVAGSGLSVQLGDLISLNWAAYGPMVGGAWFVQPVVGAGNITVWTASIIPGR